MTTAPTGSRARTRQAILDAAITILSRNPAASLGEVAAAADVGRTTLHRYFPERGDLVAAMQAEAESRLVRARLRARIADDTGADAVRRLCQEYFDLGDVLSLLFRDQGPGDQGPGDSAEPAHDKDNKDDKTDKHGQNDHDDENGPGGSCDPEFAAMVRRGYADGSIDPDLPPDWVQSLIWSQLYAGWSYLAEPGASRHEVLRLVLRSVEGAVRPLRR
ncbi:TetR/AcrR family transcriptional regulator [Actinoplanes sp. DH11]|uniref:TetR/AcrR family transcriptional regulator n=1 Tax=Actinoplanes sp. DH11 TaxID=2857011 RepID=UPI001E3A6AC7|nr:helix-turn-helix domain-containing protein [Actinoplanes sp. DH11]